MQPNTHGAELLHLPGLSPPNGDRCDTQHVHKVCEAHYGTARQLYLMLQCNMDARWTPTQQWRTEGTHPPPPSPVAGVMCFRGTAVQLRHVSGPPRASCPQHCVDSPVHSSRRGYDSPAGSPAAGTANSGRCGRHGGIHCPDCPSTCRSR